MVRRVSKHHYVAEVKDHVPGGGMGQTLMNSAEYRGKVSSNYHRGYYTDEDSRPPSDRTMTSEYGHHEITNGNGTKIRTNGRSRSLERTPPLGTHSISSHRINNNNNHNGRQYDEASDIYVANAYRSPSEMSRGSRYSHRELSNYSYRSAHPAPSEVSTIKSKITRKPGMTIETMAAPNPFCPNTKGICCLMLLLNLGLILVTLGFVIVLQFFEPFFIWVLGIVFLVFGFLTLMGSLIYCVYVCKDAKTPKQVAMEDHYWTHHWQKSFGATPPPEIRYKNESLKNYPSSDHLSDGYSTDRRRPRY